MGGEGEVGLFGRHLCEVEVVFPFCRKYRMAGYWENVYSVGWSVLWNCHLEVCNNTDVFVMTCMQGLLGSSLL